MKILYATFVLRLSKAERSRQATVEFHQTDEGEPTKVTVSIDGMIREYQNELRPNGSERYKPCMLHVGRLIHAALTKGVK
jgi:hypothetical protein